MTSSWILMDMDRNNPCRTKTKHNRWQTVWTIVGEYCTIFKTITLLWRHNGHDGVSNHRRLDCVLNRLFRRRSQKISKPCVTGFCEGKAPVTGEFPAQRASSAENISIWWHHYVYNCNRATNDLLIYGNGRNCKWKSTPCTNRIFPFPICCLSIRSVRVNLYDHHIINGLLSAYTDIGIKTNGNKTDDFKFAYAQSSNRHMRISTHDVSPKQFMKSMYDVLRNQSVIYATAHWPQKI